jgi:DNA repair protein REV1
MCDRPSKRFVLHVDMDSFFASVVLRRYPQYKDKPVAISHNGKAGPDRGEAGGKDSTSECATCNYHARRFGIKKGMFLGRARALCPSLIVLPYDFEGYEEVSEQVGEICHRYAGVHFGVVETVSCDESYMEVYVESSAVVTQLAQDLRREIEEVTQCTASIGVARNKLLAKLATGRIKPNGWYVASDHVELLRKLQLRELHGIGYRSGPKLTEQGLVSVRDVWDRGDSAEKELQTILGKQLGTKIYNFCQGIDERPVHAVERKTIGAEVGDMRDEKCGHVTMLPVTQLRFLV